MQTRVRGAQTRGPERWPAFTVSFLSFHACRVSAWSEGSILPSPYF